jgi:uncharacterized protein
MKTNFCWGLLAACLSLLGWGCASPLFAQESAQLKKIKLKSAALNQTRELFVYTPAGYKEQVHTRYGVVYVFDAQEREMCDLAQALLSFRNNGGSPFLVVGVSSVYQEKYDHSRASDFLPVLQTEASKNVWGNYSGHADAFFKFVQSEVFNYIDKKYRTLPYRMGVGHSLGASFLMYALLKDPTVFQSYIAISPNLAYDDRMLATQLCSFNWERLGKSGFVYLSIADEAAYWPEFAAAFDATAACLTPLSEHPLLVIEEWQSETHWNSYAPALTSAFDSYFKNVYSLQQQELSSEAVEVVVQVEVPKGTGDVFITGNQDALGNWQPGEVKMQRISETRRSLRVQLRSPAQFKFTLGSWPTEATVHGSFGNLMLIPSKGTTYRYKVLSFGEGQ